MAVRKHFTKIAFPFFLTGVGVLAAAIYSLQFSGEQPQLLVAQRVDYAAFRTLSPEEQKQTLDAMMTVRGIEGAWSFLQAVYPTATDNPHHLAHFIGDRTYELIGIDGIVICAKTARETFGGYGCYHALMARALAHHGPRVVQEARDRCANVPGASYPVLGGCLHGMGHGFTTFEQFNLKSALRDCDVLRDDEEFHCWDGVFMEYMFSMPHRSYREGDPWFLCASVPEKYRLRCAFYLPQMLLTTLGFDVRRSEAVCVSSGGVEVIERCLAGVGSYVGLSSGDNVEALDRECSMIRDSRYRSICITAALQRAVYLDFIDWRKTALPVCRELEEEFRAKCETALQDFAKMYHRD